MWRLLVSSCPAPPAPWEPSRDAPPAHSCQAIAEPLLRVGLCSGPAQHPEEQELLAALTVSGILLRGRSQQELVTP